MTKKKSDTRKFLETSWIMFKYDVLPWMVAAGLFALFVVKLQDSKDKGVSDKVQFEQIFKTNTQNQR